MSVRTTADEKLNEAREHVRAALKALNEIVVLECWGHDDYNDEFTDELKQAHATLVNLRDKLR